MFDSFCPAGIRLLSVAVLLSIFRRSWLWFGCQQQCKSGGTGKSAGANPAND